MKKQELFLIGEVSRLFHISIGILRHYDKIGLLKPEYTDSDTGYRYYSTRQFECLNTIRYLRALDMPLEKIAEFLQNRDVDRIQELLREQKQEISRRRMELQMMEKKIDHRLSQIADALSSEMEMITIKDLPARRIAMMKAQVNPKNYLDLENSIRQLEEREEHSVTFLGKVGVGISEERLVHGEYKPYDLVFLILDEEDQFQGTTIQIPPETCMTLRFAGGHEQAAIYYEKMESYRREHGYEIQGFSKEITMIDNGLTNDVGKFVTEIQIPVRKNQ